MSDKYILNGHKPIPEPDLMKWGEWMQTANRTVKKTRLEVSIKPIIGEEKKLGLVEVSTVFLGLDHNYPYCGDRPLLFETMIFGGELDQECERCSTWEEAEIMHQMMIEKAKASGQ